MFEHTFMPVDGIGDLGTHAVFIWNKGSVWIVGWDGESAVSFLSVTAFRINGDDSVTTFRSVDGPLDSTDAQCQAASRIARSIV